MEKKVLKGKCKIKEGMRVGVDHFIKIWPVNEKDKDLEFDFVHTLHSNRVECTAYGYGLLNKNNDRNIEDEERDRKNDKDSYGNGSLYVDVNDIEVTEYDGNLMLDSFTGNNELLRGYIENRTSTVLNKLDMDHNTVYTSKSKRVRDLADIMYEMPSKENFVFFREVIKDILEEKEYEEVLVAVTFKLKTNSLLEYFKEQGVSLDGALVYVEKHKEYLVACEIEKDEYIFLNENGYKTTLPVVDFKISEERFVNYFVGSLKLHEKYTAFVENFCLSKES